MAQRNNPYYNQIMQGRGSTDLVYQPEDNSEMIDRYANLLQQRQGEFDTSKARMAEAQGRFGETDTYDPNMLNDRVDQFTGGVEKMVQDRYNGDWGAASSEILKSISKERGADFYKYNKYLNEQAKQQQQAKSKYGDNFITTQDLTRQGLLGEAIQSQDPYGMLSANNYDRPNYSKEALSYAKNVAPNVSEELFAKLGITDQAKVEELSKLAVTNPDLFYRQLRYESPNNNLDAAIEPIADMIFNDNEAVLHAEYPELSDEEIKNKLKDITGKATGILKYNKETEEAGNFGKYASEVDNVTPKKPLITRDYGNTAIVTENRDNWESESKNIDIDNPDASTETHWFKDWAKAIWKNKNIEDVKKENKLEYQAEYNKKVKNARTKIDNWEGSNISLINRRTGNSELKYSEKGNAIANMEDAYYNTTKRLITFGNYGKDETIVANKMKTALDNKLIQPQSVTSNGKKIGNLDNFEVTKKFLFRDKDVSIQDFSPKGFNGNDGKIRAMYNGETGSLKNSEIEYYANTDHQTLGQELEKYNTSLEKNGYALDNFTIGNAPVFTIKKANPSRTDITDYGGYENLSFVLDDVKYNVLESKINTYKKDNNKSKLSQDDINSIYNDFYEDLIKNGENPTEFGELKRNYIDMVLNLTEASVINNKE